jgi:hypothetical protein
MSIKHIEKGSEEWKKLRALGYRADRNAGFGKIALCVERLRMGDKPWQLYGEWAKERIVSQGLGIKIGKDYAHGKLDFLEPFRVDESEKAVRDPFRITRYDIVKEAEEMAPHGLWNLGHIKGLGMDQDTAEKFLQEYDTLRDVRFDAEVPITDYQFDDNFGKQVMLAMPPVRAMRNFRGLSRYLSMLYAMAYSTEYPEAPQEWVARACEFRVRGQLTEKDDRPVIAADNIFRYQVWESRENLLGYFRGLRRLSNTRVSHEKFVKELIKRFGIWILPSWQYPGENDNG